MKKDKKLVRSLALAMCKRDENDCEDYRTVQVYECYARIAVKMIRLASKPRAGKKEGRR